MKLTTDGMNMLMKTLDSFPLFIKAIALEYLYHHAADQVRLGNIQLGENAFQLKNLQDQGDFPAFLRSVRNFQVRSKEEEEGGRGGEEGSKRKRRRWASGN